MPLPNMSKWKRDLYPKPESGFAFCCNVAVKAMVGLGEIEGMAWFQCMIGDTGAISPCGGNYLPTAREG